MNTDVPIVPDEITTKQTAVSFIVTCRSLELFTTASFLVNLLDIKRNIISSQLITLTTEQYLEWGSNDDYIINLVATILNVTPLPPVVPDVPVVPI